MKLFPGGRFHQHFLPAFFHAQIEVIFARKWQTDFVPISAELKADLK